MTDITDIVTVRDAELAGDYVRRFAHSILHGDDEHKRWLLKAANEFSRLLMLEVE